MKTLCIIILTASLVSTVFAQTDSIINTKNTKCEFYTTYKIKDESSGFFKSKRDSVQVKNIKSIVFLKDDSLLVKKGFSVSWGLNINGMKEVGIKSGNYQFVGLGLGILLGGLAGFLVTETGAVEAVGGFDFTPDWVTTLSTVIGVGVGGFIGILIGANTDSYEYLDMFEIPEKDKKADLIKFLKEKR
jgi:hypothetical protein